MIRAAVDSDVHEIHTMIRELAEYEREPDAVEASAEDLAVALFSEQPLCHALVAVTETDTIAGFALWFVTYSTWRGRHGIYLEDLYVRPEHRGQGYGRSLLTTIAGIAHERGYSRFEWSVLDWNAPSIAFYESMGAEPVPGWTKYRLSGSALEAVARTISG